VTVPPAIAVVCVGGATLGGSGKTPLAIACARELSAAGARVALVGHAYRASPKAARTVIVHADGTAESSLADVGDEALVCARALRGVASVVVGPSRRSAIEHAVRTVGPEVLVIDGPLRLRGRARGVLSLLAVDAARPWGSGRLPPAGDLRAPRAALVACADHVVAVDARPARVRWSAERHPIESLRGRRVGLFTAMARPDRLVTRLREAGVELHVILSIADHGPMTAGARAQMEGCSVDGWIATEKCALHLAGTPLAGPLGVLESELALPLHVRRALAVLKG
jgi:tetraacyldisaccharide 4'-kinase